MRTTASLAALTVGLVAAATACSDDAAALTREEWVAQANVICLDAEARAGVAFATHQGGDLRDELVAIFRAQVDRLEALAPPTELREDVDALTVATRSAVDEAARLDLAELDEVADDLFTEVDRLASRTGVLECGVSEDAEPSPPAEPSLSISGVEDGEEVRSPVAITMVATGVTIEPAGDVRPGAGHLHLMIDVPCVAAGSTVPVDDAHRHFGRGQNGLLLDLPPGRHTLCAQVADGAHTALDLTAEVTIDVVGD